MQWINRYRRKKTSVAKRVSENPEAKTFEKRSKQRE